MAKQAKSDRSDPKKNKSLAIRMMLKKMPTAKAAEIVAGVKKEFGHTVSANQVYMLKTKTGMASDGRVDTKKAKSKSGGTPMVNSAMWVDAIRQARQLLKATGSVANATALLKAIDS